MTKAITLAMAAAMVVIAGCAGPGTNPPPQAAATFAAGASTDQYQMIKPVREGDREARVFYLVRNAQQQWELAFDEHNPVRDGSERLLYWPKTRKVAFQFNGANDDSGLCSPQQQDRSKYGYTLCSSAFLTEDSRVGSTAGRAVAGLISAGMTEIAIARQGKKNMMLNVAEVRALLQQLTLDRAFWLHDYRAQFKRAQGRSSYNEFLRRYDNDDPEGLAVRAREALRTLDSNNRIYQEAEGHLPAIGSYKARYFPANPERYCRSLKSDADTVAACHAMARQVVDQLATARATVARRNELCRAVSRTISASSAMCEAYAKTSSCTASDDTGRRVCDIVTRKGQS